MMLSAGVFTTDLARPPKTCSVSGACWRSRRPHEDRADRHLESVAKTETRGHKARGYRGSANIRPVDAGFMPACSAAGNYYGILQIPAFNPVFTFKVRPGSRKSIGEALPAFTPVLIFMVGSFLKKVLAWPSARPLHQF